MPKAGSDRGSNLERVVPPFWPPPHGRLPPGRHYLYNAYSPSSSKKIKSFTRIILILICFTVTNKIDKTIDLTLNSNLEYSNTLKNATIQNSTTNTTLSSDQQTPKWSTVFWPFWIYISIYLILSLTSLVLFMISLLKYCALIFSTGEIELNQIRQQDLHLSQRRRGARQMLLGRVTHHNVGSSSRRSDEGPSQSPERASSTRINNAELDPEEAEIMFQMTNDMEFAVSYFKVKRKINLMSSIWLTIIACFGTFVSIMFIYQLGQYLDSLKNTTQLEQKASRQRFVNSFYLIFVYVGTSLITTLLCNKYLHAWILSLYGQLPLKLMQEDSYLANRLKSRLQQQQIEAAEAAEEAAAVEAAQQAEAEEEQQEQENRVSTEQREAEDMAQIKARGTRPILSEELLDIEDKREFVEKMNFKIVVPRVLVRINATYYQKLSQVINSQTTQVKFNPIQRMLSNLIVLQKLPIKPEKSIIGLEQELDLPKHQKKNKSLKQNYHAKLKRIQKQLLGSSFTDPDFKRSFPLILQTKSIQELENQTENKSKHRKAKSYQLLPFTKPLAQPPHEQPPPLLKMETPRSSKKSDLERALELIRLPAYFMPRPTSKLPRKALALLGLSKRACLSPNSSLVGIALIPAEFYFNNGTK